MPKVPHDLLVSAVAGILGSKKEAARFVDALAEDVSLDDVLRQASDEKQRRDLAYQEGKHAVVESKEQVRERKIDLLYVVRSLSFCGLPYDQPDEQSVSRFVKMPDGTLRVTYSSSQPDVSVVYGSVDRKVLAWMCTQGVKSNNNRIRFDEVDEILEVLGMSDGSGYPRLYESLERWKRCTIDMDWIDNDKRSALSLGGRTGLIRSWRLPRDRKADPGKGKELWLELSLDFFQLLQKEPFPVPWEYLKPFSDSPMQWDLALFLAARVASAQRETAIPLYSKFPEVLTIKSQLGIKDSNNTRFTKKVESTLEQIKKHWTELNAEVVGRTLVIKPSTYMVKHTAPRRTLYSAFEDDPPNDTPPLIIPDTQE